MTYQPPRNYNRTDSPIIKTAEPLSDEFLNKLVAELDNDEIVGIIFGGSYARNEATPFSDIDIACFVPNSLLSYAISKLLSWLAEAVAVQRGVLVKNDSSYCRQVQESVGIDSAWTRYHRLVAGVEAGSTGEMPVRARGVAALQLYGETLKLLWSVMYPDHVEVAE